MRHVHGGAWTSRGREPRPPEKPNFSPSLTPPLDMYVVVIPLRDRQASTWLKPFLDWIMFTFGAPDALYSDDAPEFLSEALDLLAKAKATDIKTTTTLGHNTRGNATIKVWWRFWNRCLRLLLLSDYQYLRWPEFAQRIAFVHNAATHKALNVGTPFSVYYGSEARNTLASSLANAPPLSEDEELALPAQFAEAVALSTHSRGVLYGIMQYNVSEVLLGGYD
jgi:hypothetical protein